MGTTGDKQGTRLQKVIIAFLVYAVVVLGFVSYLMYQKMSNFESELELRTHAAVELIDQVQAQQEGLGLLEDRVFALASISQPTGGVYRSLQAAITMQEATSVHIGPALTYHVPFALGRGTLVLIIYTEDGWDHVEVPSLGRKGYIRDSQLLRIGSDQS